MRRLAQSSLAIGLLCLCGFLANLRSLASYDSLAASVLPFQLVRGEGLDLDAWADLPRPIRYSLSESTDGRWVALYALATPLLVTPLYLPFAFAPEFELRHHPDESLWRLGMEKLAAGIVAALTTVLLRQVLLGAGAGALRATGLALLYAFASPTWSITSQALWSHGASQLGLTTALLLWLRDDRARPRVLIGLGFAASLVAAARPLGAIYAVAIALLVLRRLGLRRSLPLLLTAVACASVLLAYNQTTFGTITGGYLQMDLATVEALSPTSPQPEALAGLLVSTRGLLFACPYLLALAWRRPRPALARSEVVLLGGAAVATWLAYSCFWYWHGGQSYAGRYLSDSLPVLFLLLAPPAATAGGWLRRFGFGTAVAWALVVQIVGVWYYPGGGAPDYERLGVWSFERSAFARALAAGPATPDFPLPWSKQPAPVPAGGLVVAALAPRTSAAGAEVVVKVAVENQSGVGVSSVGGLFGVHGTRLELEWIGPEDGGPPVSVWLARDLAPGATRHKAVRLLAPEVGAWTLDVRVVQRQPGGSVVLAAAPPLRVLIPGPMIPSAIPGPELFRDGFESGDAGAWD